MYTISIKRIFHRGVVRIGVLVPFGDDYKNKITQVQGRAWSQTRKYWHVPHTKIAYEQLHYLFDEIKILTDEPAALEAIKHLGKGKKTIEVEVSELPKRLKRRTIEKSKTSHSDPSHSNPSHSNPSHSNPSHSNPSHSNQDNYQSQSSYNPKAKKTQAVKSFRPPNQMETKSNGNPVYIGQDCLVRKINYQWLACYIPSYEQAWRQTIKTIGGWRWNEEQAYWQLPYVQETLSILREEIPRGKLIIDFPLENQIPKYYLVGGVRRRARKPKRKKIVKIADLNQSQQEAITRLKEALMIQRYSTSTIKGYTTHFKFLLLYHGKTHPNDITIPQLQEYILHQIEFKQISVSMQNITISATKYYWEQVLKRSKAHIDIARPRKGRKLPNVLSKEEVLRLLSVIENLKHKLILLLLYSAGLRRSEVVNLRVNDINVERSSIFVKAGKGKKDRYVVLAQTAVPYLAAYRHKYRPDYWLFEGIHGAKYSATSVQKIFKKAQTESDINPYATIHTLRHSFATHCVEAGYSLKMVQESLGHSSLKTTEIYLHIAADVLKQMQSPLDSFDLS